MSINVSRRGFLAGILAAASAPAIVKAGIIMPIKPSIIIPQTRFVIEIDRANLTIVGVTREAVRLWKNAYAPQYAELFSNPASNSVRIKLPADFTVAYSK